MNLPRPLPPAEAGARQLGGWIAPDGRFFPAAHGEHLQMAALLRMAGAGPRDRWALTDRPSWVKVQSSGEALAGIELTQSQLDALHDLLHAAPPGNYRASLVVSLRQQHEMEALARG